MPAAHPVPPLLARIIHLPLLAPPGVVTDYLTRFPKNRVPGRVVLVTFVRSEQQAAPKVRQDAAPLVDVRKELLGVFIDPCQNQ